MLATTEKRLEIKQFTYKEDIDLSRWHECIEKIEVLSAPFNQD